MISEFDVLKTFDFEGHPIHVISMGTGIFYLGHEVARALGPEAHGDRFLDNIIGDWTLDGSVVNGRDYLLWSRVPFSLANLVDRRDIRPVVLLRVLVGVENALMCAGEFEEGIPWQESRVAKVKAGLKISEWDPSLQGADLPLPASRLKVVEIPALDQRPGSGRGRGSLHVAPRPA
ncbi:MAG: hypothetical protein H6716_29040 [Polyangiaceae bacterium]|nr:hypothetical protein [Polyangiaceae bacterium]